MSAWCTVRFLKGSRIDTLEQPTRDAPRLYTWEFTTHDEGRLIALDCSISEETMLNICGRPPHTGSWGFTFVRLDP